MRAVVQIVVAALLVTALMAVAGLIYVVSTGLKAQPEPGAMETRVARTIRGFAIPSEVKARSNPIGTSAEDLKPGLEHFARYCAMCHGNDGSGDGAAIGRGLFPKPPDMRAEATRRLTDGEIFYIIENGVRFTGMPAFGTGEPDPAGEKQVWQLVRFVRHLPEITPDEIEWMKSLNPL
jgi:mono/diheme cytochrome c family protein